MRPLRLVQAVGGRVRTGELEPGSFSAWVQSALSKPQRDTVQALGENMLSRTCTAAEIGSQHRTVLRATYGNDTSLGMWDQGNN